MAATSTTHWHDAVHVSVVGQAPNRKVIANQRLKQGTTILREAPTLTILHTNHWGSKCHHCFSSSTAAKQQPKLLRCSQCQTFYYCSKACQKSDWKYHKMECPAVAARRRTTTIAGEELVLLADAILAARVLALPQPTQSNKVIMDLVFHEECIQSHHYEIAKLMRTWGLLPKRKDNGSITDRDIVQLLARFDANNFGIVDDLLFLVGTGIFPAGAMLNHSCAHNCAIAYQPNTHRQIIRTIVEVQAGEELCHPYVDFASTSVQRRQKLSATYGFDCQCSRCRDPDACAEVDYFLTARMEGIEDEDVANTTISRSEQWLQEAAMADDMEKELHLVQQCVAARAKVLHPRHLSLYQARSQLHTTAMAAGALDVARDQCAEIVETMTTCFYRPEHPLVGIMQYTLGSLYHSLNEYSQAIKCYEKALPILECYHGRDHSLTIGCKDYLEQARQEL